MLECAQFHHHFAPCSLNVMEILVLSTSIKKYTSKRYFADPSNFVLFWTPLWWCGSQTVRGSGQRPCHSCWIEKAQSLFYWPSKSALISLWKKCGPLIVKGSDTDTEVVRKIGRLQKFNRAREIEFNFLSLGQSLWNLALLLIMFMATNRCLRCFNFCLGN